MEKEGLRIRYIQTYQGFPSISYVVSEFFGKITKVGMEAAVLIDFEIEVVSKFLVLNTLMLNIPKILIYAVQTMDN